MKEAKDMNFYEVRIKAGNLMSHLSRAGQHCDGHGVGLVFRVC